MSLRSLMRPALGCVALQLRCGNVSGTREEWMSFGPLIEFSTLGARLVPWSVRAQEAVVAKDNATLKDILHKMAVALDELSRRFGRIDPQRKAVVHVDQAIWAKTVGPVAAPIIQGQISNSGTSSPTVNLMDAFLGRALYENFVGMDCKELMEHYPVNWRLFIESLRAVDVGMYCAVRSRPYFYCRHSLELAIARTVCAAIVS